MDTEKRLLVVSRGWGWEGKLGEKGHSTNFLL